MSEPIPGREKNKKWSAGPVVAFLTSHRQSDKEEGDAEEGKMRNSAAADISQFYSSFIIKKEYV